MNSHTTKEANNPAPSTSEQTHQWPIASGGVRANIDLDLAGNQEFFEAIEQFNTISDLCDRLILDQRLTQRPFLMLNRLKKSLKQLGGRIGKLEHERDVWKMQVGSYLERPRMTFDQGQPKDLMFLHYTSTLRWLAQEMDKNVGQAIANQQYLEAYYTEQRNFLIAIGSAVLSFVGLLTAILL